MHNQLSIPRVIIKRLADDWKLLLAVFIGIMIATTLAAGTPVYLGSLEELAFRSSLDRLSAADIEMTGADVVLSEKAIQEAEQSVTDAIDRHISPIYLERERYLKGGVSLIGLPTDPLPEGGGTGVIVSRGYLQYLSNLQNHSRFIEGRMAGNDISIGQRGPEVEAVVAASTADRFGINVGDVVTLSSALGAANVLSAQIVGILAPADPTEEYWTNASAVLEPLPSAQPLPLLVQVDPDEPPVSLFVTEDVMVNVLGEWDFSTWLGEEVYLRGGISLVGLPTRPLPVGGGSGVLVRVGYLQHITNLETHSTFVQGRMAGDSVSMGARGPELEAVITVSLSKRLEINLGDVIAVSPTLGAATVISARIVGFFEPEDPKETYWGRGRVFLEPGAMTQGPLLVQVDPDVSTVVLFVTEEAMVEAVVQAYPGALGKPIWSIMVDKERLKEWTTSEARRRLKDFDDEILESMPGSWVNTGLVRSLTDAGERESFFSRVPLLLLLTVIVATVLFFLSMMVSYLVQRRESDTALLRTLGFGAWRLLRLNALEGLVMTAVAVAVAPFLAMAVVALAGKLPFFRRRGAVPVYFRDTWGVGSAGRTPAAQATVVEAAHRALLPSLQPGCCTARSGDPSLLGAAVQGPASIRRTLQGRKGERGTAPRARPVPDRGRAAFHAILPAVAALRKWRVPCSRASAGRGDCAFARTGHRDHGEA